MPPSLIDMVGPIASPAKPVTTEEHRHGLNNRNRAPRNDIVALLNTTRMRGLGWKAVPKEKNGHTPTAESRRVLSGVPVTKNQTLA